MRTYYSKGGGLREWVKQNWVDIAKESVGTEKKKLKEIGAKIEKQLAAQYGDKKRITRGDVITAAKKKGAKNGKAMSQR